jgi:cation:H+ antiporter
MLVPILLILVSCGILFIGAELLVRGGSSLALKLGLTPLVVGLTVVAYGTSTPELLVSLKSAFAGRADIAIGNVVGSNIFNIAVILGVSALVYPIKTNLQVLKWDAPVLVVATLLASLTFLDGVVSAGEGVALLGCAVLYTWWAVRMAKRDEKLGHEAHVDVPEIRRKRSTFGDILKITAGLLVLMGASRLLVDNAVVIAKTLGLSDTVIGLTIIAAGTSLPELATSLVAAFRGQSDIALGNVVGSSLFNLFFVLGGAAVVSPVPTTGLQKADLFALIGLSVLLVPILGRGLRVSRAEGGLLFCCYIAYVLVMWPK